MTYLILSFQYVFLDILHAQLAPLWCSRAGVEVLELVPIMCTVCLHYCEVAGLELRVAERWGCNYTFIDPVHVPALRSPSSMALMLYCCQLAVTLLISLVVSLVTVSCWVPAAAMATGMAMAITTIITCNTSRIALGGPLPALSRLLLTGAYTQALLLVLGLSLLHQWAVAAVGTMGMAMVVITTAVLMVTVVTTVMGGTTVADVTVDH